jgi:hypothetical protein
VRRLIAILVVVLLGAGALLLSRSQKRTALEPTEARSPEPGASSPPSTPPDPGRISRELDAGSLRSLHDEERRFLEIREAVRENRLSDMRDLARDYLRDYPHGVLRAQVESYSGVHPRPSGPDAQ